VGGRDTGSLRATLTVADVILIPFQPRSVDLWTGSQIAALVAEARHVNEEQAFAILNVADPQGSDRQGSQQRSHLAAGAVSDVSGAGLDGLDRGPGAHPHVTPAARPRTPACAVAVAP
jgi:hypothetical protein